MKFQEKLRRIAPMVNKSRAGRSVGLKPNVISTYMAKGSLPRADIAFKIAKSLQVPVAWLLDDEADWPPPRVEPRGLDSITDEELLLELARRCLRSALRCPIVVETRETIETELRTMLNRLRRLQGAAGLMIRCSRGQHPPDRNASGRRDF